MENHLQQNLYFVGETYTIADISLCAYTQVAHEAGIEMNAFQNIRKWLSRIAEQEGFIPMEPVS